MCRIFNAWICRSAPTVNRLVDCLSEKFAACRQPQGGNDDSIEPQDLIARPRSTYATAAVRTTAALFSLSLRISRIANPEALRAVARTLVRSFAAGHRERRLTRVIVLKDGRRLRTLQDAADTVLTRFDRTSGRARHAIERLLAAAESGKRDDIATATDPCSACYRFGICFEERRNFHAADPAHPMAAKAVVPRVPRDHAASSDMRVPLT